MALRPISLCNNLFIYFLLNSNPIPLALTHAYPATATQEPHVIQKKKNNKSIKAPSWNGELSAKIWITGVYHSWSIRNSPTPTRPLPISRPPATQPCRCIWKDKKKKIETVAWFLTPNNAWLTSVVPNFFRFIHSFINY